MIENRRFALRPIFDPFVETKQQGPYIKWQGDLVSTSYGMGEAAYDIRLAEPVTLIAGRMVFGLSFEHIRVPDNLRARCDDKSTNLRLGLRVAGRAEPGWHGHLTLELMYIPVEGGPSVLDLPAGWGIAAIEFAQLASSANAYPPDGKYQGPTTIQGAR